VNDSEVMQLTLVGHMIMRTWRMYSSISRLHSYYIEEHVILF